MTANTFTEAVQLQTTIMLNIAKRLDERGWAVMIHDQNLKTQFLHGMVTVANEVGAKRRRRPVIVEVKIDWKARSAVRDGRWLGQWMQLPFRFHCRIPSTKAYDPIHAALEVMSQNKARRWDDIQAKVLERWKMSTMQEYQGNNKDALEVLLKVLDMPHHREILTGGRKLL